MNFNNIFSKNTLSQQQTPSYMTSLESLSGDYDYELTLLENLSITENSFNDIVTEHARTMYTGMKLNSSEILEEGFKDALHDAAEFFKKLLSRIIEFFKKAFTFFNSYIGDFEKFITSHKSELEALTPDFELEMYEYTFDKHVPNDRRINDIVASYNSDVNKMRSMSYGDLVEEKQQFMSKSHLNKLRAEVLGQTGEIDEENYLSEAKQVFRSGESAPRKIHVNATVLKNTLKDYSVLKQELNNTKKEQMNIQNTLNSMKRFFDASPSVYYSNNEKKIGTRSIERTDTGIKTGEKEQTNYEFDHLKILNLFFNYKFEQSKIMSVLLTNAYFEKLAALKEALITYKRIIRGSMFKADSEKDGDKK